MDDLEDSLDCCLLIVLFTIRSEDSLMPEVVHASLISYLVEHWEVFIWIGMLLMITDLLRRKTYFSNIIRPFVAGGISLVIFFIVTKILSPELWDRFVSFWTLGRY
jgi:hypothetical protein